MKKMQDMHDKHEACLWHLDRAGQSMDNRWENVSKNQLVTKNQ